MPIATRILKIGPCLAFLFFTSNSFFVHATSKTLKIHWFQDKYVRTQGLKSSSYSNLETGLYQSCLELKLGLCAISILKFRLSSPRLGTCFQLHLPAVLQMWQWEWDKQNRWRSRLRCIALRNHQWSQTSNEEPFFWCHWLDLWTE